jgi:1-acyl-sn-glycerol-3-phosphate acyltransferase
MVQRSLPKRVWYDFLRVFFRVFAVAVWRIRVFGRQNVPSNGGVLVVWNHQSHLDPILVGLACDRRLNFVARDTMFGFPPFRWLISSLDAIPIDREGIGLGGLKESLRRLKAGEMLAIFPEGTRTRDGEVGEMKPGFLALARRAKVPLLPVGLDGSFDSWPRRSLFPWPAIVHVCVGQPLSAEEMSHLGDEKLLAEVDRRIRQCTLQARTGKERGMNCGLYAKSSMCQQPTD